MSTHILELAQYENTEIVSDKTLYSLDEQLRRCVRQQERDWLQKGLTVEGDLDQVDYYGNEELVEHIWSNLLSNAIRFTPAGGQITVVLRKEPGAVSVAVGIGLQNFPEGAAVSLPLRREGCSRSRSFLVGQASALVEPMAGVLGAWLVTYVQRLLPYALSFAAGAMILVAVHELIPECQKNRQEQPYFATMGIILGFAAMMLLDVMLG